MPASQHQWVSRAQLWRKLRIRLKQTPDVLARLGRADKQQVLLRQRPFTSPGLKAGDATGYDTNLGLGGREIARKVTVTGRGNDDDPADGKMR